MKISELIKLLAGKIQDHGDCEVGIFYANEDYARLGVKTKEGVISPLYHGLPKLQTAEIRH